MADDKHGTNTGGALTQEQRMYVYRKGETVAREVKYNAQEGIFVMGEMMDNPPTVSSAPVGTSPLAHFYGTNKHEITEEDLRRDENVYENREPKRENDEHWKKSTYLHDKAEEREVAAAAVIHYQNRQKEVSQEDERVHPDQLRDVERKTAAMIASYEATHGQTRPLSDKGKDNIRELCTNYVNSQNKLKSQDFTTFEQPKLASDTLAYGMMENGLEQKDAARTLWDVNNVHYADNMRFLAERTADYQDLVKQEDSSLFRNELIDPEKQSMTQKRAYAQVQSTVSAAEQYYEAQKKRPVQSQRRRHDTLDTPNAQSEQQNTNAAKGSGTARVLLPKMTRSPRDS